MPVQRRAELAGARSPAWISLVAVTVVYVDAGRGLEAPQLAVKRVDLGDGSVEARVVEIDAGVHGFDAGSESCGGCTAWKNGTLGGTLLGGKAAPALVRVCAAVLSSDRGIPFPLRVGVKGMPELAVVRTGLNAAGERRPGAVERATHASHHGGVLGLQIGF